MESPTIPGGWRALAALSAATALLWALTRHNDGTPPPPAPPVLPAAALAPAKPAAEKKAAAEPDKQPQAHRTGLSEEGEALGGTPPKRGGGR